MLFPDISLPTTDGASVALGGAGWRALFVIRGAHCQICRAYLGQLEAKRAAWESRGVEVLVVSADPVPKSRDFMKAAGYRGRAACGLDVPAMRAMGLWMTGPDTSTLDYVHPEPGFFLIDPDANVAAVEVSTLPAARPDLEWLDRGLAYILQHDVRPPFGRYGYDTSAPLRRRGETVLLTGATGYIGSAVAQTLRAAGYCVRGLTRSEDKAAALEARGIAAIVGDVNDVDLMTTAAAGVSAIVHTAAPNAPALDSSMERRIADAVRANALVAELGAENRARVIITSGASLYGPTAGRVVDEHGPLRAPPFAASLAHAEAALAEAGRACILRAGVVYGREQSAPMRTLIQSVRARGAPALVDPDNRLSLVHVDDLADLYLAILEAPSPPTVVNGIACTMPWREVIGAIATAAGSPEPAETITPDEAAALGGPAIYMPIDMAVSGDLARRRLGWRPRGPQLGADLLARP